MTDKEKREEKAHLLLECHEAEREVAYLVEKARRYSDQLQRAANALSFLPNQDDELAYPPMAEANELKKRIVAAKSKVQDLHERRAALGL